jgi:hypothetical protein
MISGLVPDPNGVAIGVQIACGTALLSKIQQDFIRKSRREPSEDGIVWPELQPETVRRRILKGMTPAQRRRQRQSGQPLDVNPRQVDILRDTGLMLRSFSPGYFDLTTVALNMPSVEFQVFSTLPGQVIVGTNRHPWHHFGNPETNLPARHLWPPDGNLPDVWWSDILEVGVQALMQSIINVLTTGVSPMPPM